MIVLKTLEFRLKFSDVCVSALKTSQIINLQMNCFDRKSWSKYSTNKTFSYKIKVNQCI